MRLQSIAVLALPLSLFAAPFEAVTAMPKPQTLSVDDFLQNVHGRYRCRNRRGCALLEWTTEEANSFAAIGARSAQTKTLTLFSKRGLRGAIREALASLKSSGEQDRIISEQASTAQEAYPATTAWAS